MPETSTIRAVVKANHMSLLPTVESKVVRVVVDQHLHLPDMFEITFHDEDGSAVADARIQIGTAIEVAFSDTETLIEGEVTSIEGDFNSLQYFTIVRGYEKAHRLQRARRTRTFVNMTDGDIVRRVARDASLQTGTVDDPGFTHQHLAQIDQTDWEFLKCRARELGYETGVSGGELFFRKPPGMSGGGMGGAVSAAAGAAASAVGLGSGTLTYKDNLLWFRPRLSGAGLVSEAEVRVYDPKDAKVVVGKAPLRSETATLEDDAASLAGSFTGGFVGMPISLPSIPGLPDLGLPAGNNAHVVVNRPVAWGTSTSRVAETVAKGVAEHMASSFAEAEGYAQGAPTIKAGEKVTVEQVPEEFAGEWYVTNARHIFDDSLGGYYTHFLVSGRHDRSLLGLASMGATQGRDPRMEGMVIGVVTNNNDPDRMSRVKLAFPWLDPSFESDWARVVQFGLGKEWGALFVPEVGDEVLVGFEFGDVRRPYVVGGLVNGKTKVDLGGQPVKVQGPLAEVVKRGFVSRLGHRIVFDDDQMGRKSGITIGNKTGKVGIVIDDANGAITILCDAPSAAITVESKGAGSKVLVKSAGDVNVTATQNVAVEAQQNVKVTGKAGVTVEATGSLELKGATVKVQGTGTVQVSAPQVQLG